MVILYIHDCFDIEFFVVLKKTMRLLANGKKVINLKKNSNQNPTIDCIPQNIRKYSNEVHIYFT
jgi:hypothetical protein